MEHPLWSVLNFIFLQQAIEPTGASAPRGVQSLIVSSGQTCYKIEIQNNLIITRTTKKTRKPSRKGSGYLVMKKIADGDFQGFGYASKDCDGEVFVSAFVFDIGDIFSGHISHFCQFLLSEVSGFAVFSDILPHNLVVVFVVVCVCFLNHCGYFLSIIIY